MFSAYFRTLEILKIPLGLPYPFCSSICFVFSMRFFMQSDKKG